MASPIQEFDDIEEFDDDPQAPPSEFATATLDPGYFPGLERKKKNEAMRRDLNLEPVPIDPINALRRGIADPAISLAKGVIGLPEAVVGLADIPTLGHAGRLLEAGGYGFQPKVAKDFLSEFYSPEQKEANRAVDEAKGFGGTIAASLQNPSTIANTAIESIPLMLGGGGVAQKILSKAPKLGALAAGAIGEGAAGAGAAAESTRQQSESGLLTPKQAALSLSSGVVTGALGVLGGKVAQKLGIADIDTMMAGAANQASKKALAQRVVEGFVSEGLLEEMPQSALEQIQSNLANGKPWSDGVAEAAAQGALTGAVMGGAANVRGASTAPAAALVDPAASPALQPGALEFNQRAEGIAGLPEAQPIEEFDEPMEFEALDPATGSPISTIQPLLEKADARMAQIDEQRLKASEAQPKTSAAPEVSTEAQPSATAAQVEASPAAKEFSDAFNNPEAKVSNISDDPAQVTTIKTGVAIDRIADLDEMLKLHLEFMAANEASRQKMRSGKMTPAEMNAFSVQMSRKQFPREVIETATNSGSHKTAERKLSENNYPLPKLDWTKNPEVEAWLRENGKELGIELPPKDEAPPAEPPVAETPTPPETAGEIVGMGGATPSEFGSPVPYVTSNKNAKVDEERKARGLPPMMETARQSNQSAWDEAMKIVDETPDVQDRLIEELVAKPRALTPVENAMVMHRRIFLRNEYEKALHRWREMFEFDDFVRASEESQRVKDFSSQLADLEDITKATGAESGRSLQARKMMANEDYSLAAMELAAMEAKGRNLNPQEHLDLIRANERIADLERRLQAYEEGKEAREIERQTSEAVKEVESTAKGEAKSKDSDIDREERLVGGIKAKIDSGKLNEITPLVQQLARVFWRRGVRGREPMIDALHETLKTIIPEFTRDQTQRAFSGYGNFTPLSKAEIDVGLRDLRGQTQQVLKLEALEARKPLEKTGQERRVPTDEERRLIKQVNELKRKFGVVVTDPATQLKSALQSRKTYYEHRISDLKHEIETRERIVKTKSPSPTDPELDALRAEHDRLKKEHDSIFPAREITDEQRLKLAIAAAERNQAQWESRLENAEKGVFGVTRTAKTPVTSEQLETIRAETQAVKNHIQELKDLDGALLAAKREASLASQKATLEKEIAEQERKLREGDLKSPGSPMNRPADPALEELKQKRDELNKKLSEARKKPEAQKYAEAQQRELERLNKAIAEREAKVSAGDLASSAPAKKINRPLPPELEEARQKLEAVNKQLAEMRKAARPVKSKEEIALQSLKTRMATRMAELRDRIARSDFTKKERKPVALDAEGNKLKAELDAVKEEFDTKLEQDRWAKMSVFTKTRRKTADTYDAARALMTTGEFSFILRQGKLVALARPIQTAKALPDMFRALLANEQRAHEIDLAVHNHPDAPAARAAKLAIIEEGVSLHKQEELKMGRWVGKIPVVKNFNRAAQVFLNRIRFDTWQAMRKSMSKSGTPTPEEDKQIAMFVNEATGRGGLGKLEPAAVPLARVMFSPRYYASRLQLAAGHSLWGGTGRTRRIIATEYARSLIGLGLYYTMLSAAFSGGDDDDKDKGSIEPDPRSTDFGKVKIGKTRLDPLAGLSQVIVLASRTAAGEKKTSKGDIVPIRGKGVKYGGDQWSDIVARHLRGKLHPVPASVANLFDGTDLGGDEATVINQSANLIAPITYVDIYAALKEQELPDGVALALLALLGEGVQTYEKKK